MSHLNGGAINVPLAELDSFMHPSIGTRQRCREYLAKNSLIAGYDRLLDSL